MWDVRTFEIHNDRGNTESASEQCVSHTLFFNEYKRRACQVPFKIHNVPCLGSCCNFATILKFDPS